MKQIGQTLAVALIAGAAGLASFQPGAASGNPLVIYPIPATPAPAVTNEVQARAAMEHHGLVNITALGPVGSYWEANAEERGKPVVVYVFNNGTLWVQHDPKVTVQEGDRIPPS